MLNKVTKCDFCAQASTGTYGSINDPTFCGHYCTPCANRMFKKKNGFCSGTFAIPHVGHTLFIQDCKNKCDHLTVMIASDEEIIKKKGRLPVGLIHRKLWISSLKQVNDWIVSKETDGLDYLYAALLAYKTDIYFVNEDAFDLAGRIKFCEENNIEIKIMSRKDNDSGVSSSELMNA